MEIKFEPRIKLNLNIYKNDNFIVLIIDGMGYHKLGV